MEIGMGRILRPRRHRNIAAGAVVGRAVTQFGIDARPGPEASDLLGLALLLASGSSITIQSALLQAPA
jgi:hypothetical protein